MPTAVAASAMLLAACEACAGADSGGVEPRASAISQAVDLAADSGLVPPAGHDAVGVTGSLLTSGSRTNMEPAAFDGMRASDTSGVPSSSVPFAEEYVDPRCASPALDDQQHCLETYLARSDLLLDRYYQALILRLEAEAGPTPNGVEPPAVQRLRTAQRAWVAYRNDRCRERMRAHEGPLWAPMRAQCLAEYSTRRAEEVANVLSTRRAAAPREKPTKAKRSSARTSSHQQRARHR